MDTQAISVDVGGTTIKMGICTPDGSLTHRRQIPTPRDPTVLAALVASEIASIESEADHSGPTPDRRRRPVGMVMPGIVDEESGTAVRAVNLGWHDVPVRALVQAATGRAVTLGHDVRAGALAEARWGTHTSDMLFVALGTGIAAGLVLDGRLVSGQGYAGEIGQILVRDPRDGEARTLEDLASASGIARRLASRRAFDTSLGSEGVIALAAQGDADASATIADAVTALADVLAGALCLTGPLHVVVGGGLSRAGDAFLVPLHEALAARLTVTPAPALTRAVLDSWAQCLGAGALALDASAVPA